MAKEELIIDVYTDESNGDQIFFLTPQKTPAKILMPECCSDSGIFTDPDDLEEFLAEHAEEIVIVKDYRDGI